MGAAPMVPEHAAKALAQLVCWRADGLADQQAG